MTKPVSMTDALYSRLEASILTGDLLPGVQMPTQKEIAESERVSRTVVREAVARLEAQGLVVARQGSGVYVAEEARYRAFQVTRGELSELPEVIRLLETRLAIESEMAAFAAARREAADISAMRTALKRMTEAGDDQAEAAAADVQFHLAIAHATRNDYFVRLIDFLGLRLVPPRNLYLHGKAKSARVAYAAKVSVEHEAIFEAIIGMDVAGARKAAWNHMRESINRHSALID